MANSLERRADGSIALFIDGDLQFDSNDERIYHEGLALPALALATQRLQAPLKVLVIGGGDGLIAREFFKSSKVIGLDLVDYDPEILNIARNEIQDLNNNSLSDARIIVHVKDAWAFVDRALSDNILYDVIVSDLTGSVDAATARFHSIEWYSKLSRLLKHKGILSVNALSAQRTPEAYWSIFNSLAKASLHARPYHVNIPSFTALSYGEDWGFFIASREPITSQELGETLPLAEPRYFLKTNDDLHKLFLFPEEIMAYQPKSMPASADSNILMQYFCNPGIETKYSGLLANTLALDTGTLVIPEPDNGKNILPHPVRSMLAESVHQAGALGNAQDPQLLLRNILELMPSLQNEHTPELIADFLERPDTFLEAIDLPALVGRLLKRASELPARLVEELELLRDKLQEWASDHNALLLNLGQRVITILTLVVVVGNLLYPDAVYGKGEGAGHHAAAGHNGGGYNRGGYGWNNGTNYYYTNPNYKKLAPLNINEHNHVPAPGQTKQTGVRMKSNGAGNAPNSVGFIDNTRMISPNVYLTNDTKYIAVKTSDNNLVYLNGSNWYSDHGKTPLDQPYPDNFKATVVSHLSSVMRDTDALHNRLTKTKTEFVSYSQILTDELNQFKATKDKDVKFGSHTLPVAEAIRRTEASLKLLRGKVEQLDNTISPLPARIELTKAALANLTSEEA